MGTKKSGRKRGKRTDQCIDTAYRLLICYTPVSQIHKAVKEAYEGETTDQKISWYISEARKLIENRNKRCKERLVAESLKRYEDLYLNAYKQQKWAICLKVQQQIDALQGIIKLNEISSQPISTQPKPAPYISIVLEDVENEPTPQAG